MSDSLKKARIKGMDKDFISSTNLRHNGFIAQEVEQAAKDCNYDFGGVHHPESTVDNWSLSYENFVVPLVKAVQELDTKNSEKDETIIQLKKQNQQLILRMDALEQSINNYLIDIKTSKQKPALNEIDEAPELEQNIPNPFTQNTVIRFYIPIKSSSALLKIFSETGVELKSFNISAKGNGSIEINANTLSAGVYNYQLIVDGKKVDTKQMVLTK